MHLARTIFLKAASSSIKWEWQTLLCYLPDHNMPRWLLQQGPVGSDGGEQCLPSAFTHGRPWVDTQLAQFGIQAEPQAIKRRGRVKRPVEGLSFLLGLLLQSFLLPFQLLCNGFASLEEVVWNVPLWMMKKGSGRREWGHKLERTVGEMLLVVLVSYYHKVISQELQHSWINNPENHRSITGFPCSDWYTKYEMSVQRLSAVELDN